METCKAKFIKDNGISSESHKPCSIHLDEHLAVISLDITQSENVMVKIQENGDKRNEGQEEHGIVSDEPLLRYQHE